MYICLSVFFPPLSVCLSAHWNTASHPKALCLVIVTTFVRQASVPLQGLIGSLNAISFLNAANQGLNVDVQVVDDDIPTSIVLSVPETVSPESDVVLSAIIPVPVTSFEFTLIGESLIPFDIVDDGVLLLFDNGDSFTTLISSGKVVVVSFSGDEVELMGFAPLLQITLEAEAANQPVCVQDVTFTNALNELLPVTVDCEFVIPPDITVTISPVLDSQATITISNNAVYAGFQFSVVPADTSSGLNLTIVAVQESPGLPSVISNGNNVLSFSLDANQFVQPGFVATLVLDLEVGRRPDAGVIGLDAGGRHTLLLPLIYPHSHPRSPCQPCRLCHQSQHRLSLLFPLNRIPKDPRLSLGSC